MMRWPALISCAALLLLPSCAWFQAQATLKIEGDSIRDLAERVVERTETMANLGHEPDQAMVEAGARLVEIVSAEWIEEAEIAPTAKVVCAYHDDSMLTAYVWVNRPGAPEFLWKGLPLSWYRVEGYLEESHDLILFVGLEPDPIPSDPLAFTPKPGSAPSIDTPLTSKPLGASPE